MANGKRVQLTVEEAERAAQIIDRLDSVDSITSLQETLGFSITYQDLVHVRELLNREKRSAIQLKRRYYNSGYSLLATEKQDVIKKLSHLSEKLTLLKKDFSTLSLKESDKSTKGGVWYLDRKKALVRDIHLLDAFISDDEREEFFLLSFCE